MRGYKGVTGVFFWRSIMVVCLVAAAAGQGPVASAMPHQTNQEASASSTSAGTRPGQGDDALRAALQAVVDAGATGMIALVDDGHKQSRLAVGAAQLEPKRLPLRVRDQVRVGSITKTAIATITLQLVGERRLGLDDTIERWLPGAVPNGSEITVRMLLNHTSGIYNYTDDEVFFASVLADPYRHWTPQELIAVANSHPPVFPPGQGWSYSNTGYILIGLLLEKATHRPVQDLVKQRIVRPLHLSNTYFATSAQFRGRYAHGYAPPSLTGDGYQDLSSWPPSWAWAAGALVSNAPDLRRFYQALLSGRLLNPALMRAMTTTVDAGGGGFSYGLGIFSIDTSCGTVWGHDGGIPGYVSFAYGDRSGSRSTVVLLPTQPDDAIGTASEQALFTAVCRMFDRAAPPTTASGRGTSPGLLPPSMREPVTPLR